MITLWVDGILDSILEKNTPDCCIAPRTGKQEKVFNFVSITESTFFFYYILFLLQNKFGLVFFRLFDGALETSNFRFEEARSAITLLRCFLHENTQRRKIARVKFAEELGTMSKNRLRWITLVRGPIWRIHSLTLMIS